MAETDIQPDICTFNTVLGVLARCNRYTKVSMWSKQVLNEMQNCHIGLLLLLTLFLSTSCMSFSFLQTFMKFEVLLLFEY